MPSYGVMEYRDSTNLNTAEADTDRLLHSVIESVQGRQSAGVCLSTSVVMSPLGFDFMHVRSYAGKHSALRLNMAAPPVTCWR